MLLLITFVTATIAAQPPETSTRIFTSIRNLETAEAQHPGDAGVETELAFNFFLANQHLLFRDAIKKAEALDPHSEKVFYLDGRFRLEAEEDLRGAIRSFRQAVELAPSDAKARCYLAITLRELGQNQAAKAELEQIIPSASFAWPFQILAEIELDFNAPDRALIAARRAIKLDPQSMDSFLVAGKVYEALKLRADAIAMYRNAEKLDPLADAPHYRLFKLYEESEETRAASEQEASLFQKLKDQDTPQPRERIAGAKLPNGNPQARSREEFDRFGVAVLATDPLLIVRTAEEFNAKYPDSELREKALELEFEAFRQRNDYQAIKRVARNILELNQWNASVLAELALMIADENDSGSFSLAEQHATRAIAAADATARPANLSRANFFAWKDTVVATVDSARGLLALRQGDAKAAVAFVTEAIELRPAPEGADYLRLGEAHMLVRDTQLARNAFNRAEAIGPAVVAERARLERPPEETTRRSDKMMQSQKSIANYRRIISSEPNLAEAHHDLGLAYYRAHDYASARDSLQRALALKPDLEGTALFLGLAEFRLGDFQNSMRHLQSALRSEPNNREALLTLIRDQVALGHLDTSMAKAAMKAFPDDTELNYTIGLACIDRIRELAASATELGPDSPSSLWLRLRKAESAGDHRTEERLRARLTGVPEPPSVIEYDSVSALLRQGFEAVLASAPNSSAAHSIQGYLFESIGKTDPALNEYRQAGDHFAAGRLLAQNVRLDEAQSELEAAVSADPENDRAKADLGRLYVQKNEPNKATVVLQDLVKKYPKDPYAWADLGKAEGVLGNSGTAIHYLQTALSLNPGLNQLHYQLALLYRRQGREDLTNSELAIFQSNRRTNP